MGALYLDVGSPEERAEEEEMKEQRMNEGAADGFTSYRLLLS